MTSSFNPRVSSIPTDTKVKHINTKIFLKKIHYGSKYQATG